MAARVPGPSRRRPSISVVTTNPARPPALCGASRQLGAEFRKVCEAVIGLDDEDEVYQQASEQFPEEADYLRRTCGPAWRNHWKTRSSGERLALKQPSPNFRSRALRAVGLGAYYLVRPGVGPQSLHGLLRVFVRGLPLLPDPGSLRRAVAAEITPSLPGPEEDRRSGSGNGPPR
jgi:hypothetical protein